MPRKPKPAPRYAIHIVHGRGEVLSVRELASGILVADLKFADGSDRTIRVSPEYWQSSVGDLVPTPPAKPKRKPKAAVAAASA